MQLGWSEVLISPSSVPGYIAQESAPEQGRLGLFPHSPPPAEARRSVQRSRALL